MGIARSLVMAALGLTASCGPQVPTKETPAAPPTPGQIAAAREREQQVAATDMAHNTRSFAGSPLQMVLVKVLPPPSCVAYNADTESDQDKTTSVCEEDFASRLAARIDALLADRKAHGTCTLRDVEVLNARIIWRGYTTGGPTGGPGGPATLPSGALVFMECCGAPTPYPCPEIRSR